jgi:hypothetical protein
MSGFEREKRERNERETRAERRDKAEKEQRKNKETRRIFSLITSRRIGQIGHLKKGKF